MKTLKIHFEEELEIIQKDFLIKLNKLAKKYPNAEDWKVNLSYKWVTLNKLNGEKEE